MSSMGSQRPGVMSVFETLVTSYNGFNIINIKGMNISLNQCQQTYCDTFYWENPELHCPDEPAVNKKRCGDIIDPASSFLYHCRTGIQNRPLGKQ